MHSSTILETTSSSSSSSTRSIGGGGSTTTNYYVLGSTVMVFIGITTNVLNLTVLSLKSMKSTTNKYLWALAVCDLFVLVFSLITFSNSFSPLDFDSLLLSSIDFDDLTFSNGQSLSFFFFVFSSFRLLKHFIFKNNSFFCLTLFFQFINYYSRVFFLVN